MQLALELPNDIAAFQTVEDVGREVRVSYAFWLYQQQRVTLGKAAEVAGVSLYDFMSLCKWNKIPVIDVSREELLSELAGFSAK